MAEPVVIPDLGAPTEAQVTLRLREACALWAACARLQRFGAALALPNAHSPSPVYDPNSR